MKIDCCCHKPEVCHCIDSCGQCAMLRQVCPKALAKFVAEQKNLDSGMAEVIENKFWDLL